jgi:hypothetical protein
MLMSDGFSDGTLMVMSLATGGRFGGRTVMVMVAGLESSSPVLRA